MRGFIFYKGRSPIDNAPIVGIATLESKNGKTGNMIQTDEGDIPEMAPIDGWHVNVRLTADEDGAALEPFAVTPEPATPVRMWA